MNWGGLYPKNPWPMLTIGCLGDAAAASLTIDLDLISRKSASATAVQYFEIKELRVPLAVKRPTDYTYQTSCFWLATRAAGCSFAFWSIVAENFLTVSMFLIADIRLIKERVKAGLKRVGCIRSEREGRKRAVTPKKKVVTAV
jgi:hypothetical protein